MLKSAWVTTLSLTIRVYLYSLRRNLAKFSENPNLQQFKVIQGLKVIIDFGANRKRICD